MLYHQFQIKLVLICEGDLWSNNRTGNGRKKKTISENYTIKGYNSLNRPLLNAKKTSLKRICKGSSKLK